MRKELANSLVIVIGVIIVIMAAIFALIQSS